MPHNKKRQDVKAFLYRSKWALARVSVGLVVAWYVFSAAAGRR